MLRIDEMFAFVVIDETGEGVTGFMGPNGQWFPMVGADMARIDQLRPMAHELARMSGKEIRLLKFSRREELEVIKP